MELQQIRYFLQMARLLNFTRAAAACNISQPALTRAVQKLEEELGGPLFRRERGRTHLTALGRTMLPLLERAHQAAAEAKVTAQRYARGEVAPIQLGICDLADTSMLDTMLADLALAMPGLQLQLVGGSSTDLIERALAGHLDLMMIELPDEPPARLEHWHLFDQSYHLVVRHDHPLACRGEISLHDLANLALILYRGQGVERLQARCASLGLALDWRHAAQDGAHLKRMILAGLGVGFMPDPGDSQLCCIRVAGAQVATRVELAAIAGRQRSKAADWLLRRARSQQCDRTMPDCRNAA